MNGPPLSLKPARAPSCNKIQSTASLKVKGYNAVLSVPPSRVYLDEFGYDGFMDTLGGNFTLNGYQGTTLNMTNNSKSTTEHCAYARVVHIVDQNAYTQEVVEILMGFRYGTVGRSKMYMTFGFRLDSDMDFNPFGWEFSTPSQQKKLAFAFSKIVNIPTDKILFTESNGYPHISKCQVCPESRDSTWKTAAQTHACHAEMCITTKMIQTEVKFTRLWWQEVEVCFSQITVFAETLDQRLDPGLWILQTKQGVNASIKGLLQEQSVYGDVYLTGDDIHSPSVCLCLYLCLFHSLCL
jgi:hypothetical protein